MGARLNCAALLSALLMPWPAAAQRVAAGPPAAEQPGRTHTPWWPSRLAAGLRAYPDELVAALLTVAEYPELLRQLGDRPELLAQPGRIEPRPPAAALAALARLRAAPRVLEVGVSHPEQLERLGRLRRVAPDGLVLRLGQLRENYARLRLAAAAAWQRLLQNDPVALGQYRQLLTRFCQAERAAYPDFPYVQVTRRDYYYACPPDSDLLAFAAGQEGLDALQPVLERWWSRYAPERIDELAQRSRVVPPPDERGAVAALPAAQRSRMWAPPGRPAAAAIGQVPVILQPLADQPPDARREFALAEHARLWSPPTEPGPPARRRELAEAGQLEPPPAAPLPAGEQERAAAADAWSQMKQLGPEVANYGADTRRPRYRREGCYSWGGCRRSPGAFCWPYPGYGYGPGYYGLGWPFSADRLEHLRTLAEIYPRGLYLELDGLYGGYPGSTIVATGTIGRHGPLTSYCYPSPARASRTLTRVGLRRHYRSARYQITRGLRRYPTYGGRISGAPRRSANLARRSAGRTGRPRPAACGDRARAGFGNRGRTTRGARGAASRGRRYRGRTGHSPGLIIGPARRTAPAGRSRAVWPGAWRTSRRGVLRRAAARPGHVVRVRARSAGSRGVAKRRPVAAR